MDGSFCIAKPPKRAVLANCSSNEMCEELLSVSPPSAPSSSTSNNVILQCGDQGECVSNLSPQNDLCKEACESSACSSLCLQLYESKTARYCIESRDHPNALPPATTSNVPPNKYYCTCLLSNSPYHHRVVSRHLR